jgi:predicted nucleic acid-binding protein
MGRRCRRVEAFALIVVDTSVWADYFNGSPSEHALRLDEALSNGEDIALIPIIVTEVLQGFRDEKGFTAARRLLVRVPRVPLTMESHVAAASLYRALRRKGVTVRGAVDCLIARAAIESGAELLSRDEDFAAIARHSTLRLCSVPKN